jgi:Fe-Mn family superoxide dismutase
MNKLNPIQTNEKFPFALPELPFKVEEMAPYINKQTFEFHHGKHHAAYVNNLNKLVENDSKLAKATLEEIFVVSSSNPTQKAIFNNSAQVWNHTFFWHCLKGGEKGGDNAKPKPNSEFGKEIERAFGDFDQFKAEFKKSAMSVFGSGWAWLVMDENKLKITTTSNADMPIVHSQRPLYTVDVWEHAYYLDYQNRRVDFVDALVDRLANWDFVEKSFNAA